MRISTAPAPRHLRCASAAAIIWLGASITSTPAGEPAPHKDWQPIGRLEHDAIAECSGIVASRQYPGIFWVHNDSGHPGVLFAVKESGELVAEIPVAGAKNTDWEDIAADDNGHLFVGDTGNNYKLFPSRSVYEFKEPDPYASPIKPVAAVQRWRYVFSGERFDAEALYVRAGQPFVLPRQRRQATDIFKLVPTKSGKWKPEQVAALPVRDIVAADVSADGNSLLVCTPSMLRVYPLDERGVPSADGATLTVRYPFGNIEACCFDGSDVMLASENRDIYRVSSQDLSAGTRFVKPAARGSHE